MAKILLVDDEEDIRTMIATGLRVRSHTVDVAGGADEALKVAQAAGYAYDVVVIDYVLPGVRGLDLIKKLREKNRFLRAIVISGQVDHDKLEPHELERQLRDELAVDRYLPKPLYVETLEKEIESLLAGTDGDDPWQKAAKRAQAARAVSASSVKRVEKTIRPNRKRKLR